MRNSANLTNRLKEESSPYLLQHANNPVHWQPWDNTALQYAKSAGKPILLSIGYSACHWCHVMARESFENPQIAEMMNDLFICVKVDREERPDLDKIYQLAHQMLTQRPGGWPLTVALTPAGHAPFFAGTYFPPEPRMNMPGFGDLLNQIANHFTRKKEALSDYHLSFQSALYQLNPKPTKTAIPDNILLLESAVEILQQQYDETFGGFGDAPKFPHPSQLELLLLSSCCSTHFSGLAESMTKTTLQSMIDGGIYDQLGGGFFRYSVDRKWTIPHFEKMLYDNAQLLTLYSNACPKFNNPQFRRGVEKTADWVMNSMQSPSGGYYATLDADSEGEEGKYYVWSETDLRALLSESHYNLIENYFGLFGEENFEGNWHFNINPETHHELLADNPALEKEIEAAKSILLDVRKQRVSPDLDGKVLAGWNGLMIKGMASSGRVLGIAKHIESAQLSADFVRSNLWRNGRLLAASTDGQAKLNGYLDDYAFMLEGLLTLLSTKWRTRDLEFAVLLADTILEQFEDTKDGGYFFTSHDHEALLYRNKAGPDDAIPSGNAVAIQGLLKLGSLIGEEKYLQSANRALSLFADELSSQPSVNAAMTTACQFTRAEFASVIIRGETGEIETWKDKLQENYRPLVSVYAIDTDQRNLPAGLAIHKAIKQTVAYICNGTQCLAPENSLDKLISQLDILAP